ncbi:MAG: SAM-dependent chlorinase/fluorinase [Candidatus Omnitrophica bacterium]|nr:SAM-dependent chlorinase/fluorinase [Candidatus Omnitrophota bacterium]
MKIVALLTDFGTEDNFVGVTKGVILKINPKVTLVDITHQIGAHKVKRGAFLLHSSFSYFPKGTIFLVIVDPGVGSKRKALAVKTRNYYFVGPDNGVLFPSLEADGIVEAVEITNKKYLLSSISSTFHGRDVFAPIAAYLSKGVKLEKLGREIVDIKKLNLPQIKIRKNTLTGEIIYIDSFGNLVTNIDRITLEKFIKNRNFVAFLNKKKIAKFCDSYLQGEKEPFFIEGGFFKLEISLKMKSAKRYFKAKEGQKIVIKRR